MDTNLKDVGDLVKEALAQDGDPSIRTGVESQADLDAKNAPEQPVVDTPVADTPPPAPVVPQEGIESKEAPIGQNPPVGATGDQVPAPAATPEPTPEPDYTEALEAKFPGMGFKNLDDVATYANKNKGNQERITELEGLNNDYSAKLNQKLDPWANQEMAELNQFVKETGITDTGLFQSLKGADLANMDSKKVLEIQMKKDNPDMSGAEIEGYINRRYKQEPFNGDQYIDEDERRIAEKSYNDTQLNSTSDMKMDANKARRELVDLQGKIQPVDLKAEMDANQKAHEDNVRVAQENWAPHINQSVDELRQFPIEIPGKDGKNEKLASLEVPADKMEGYKNQAMRYAINAGVDHNTVAGRQSINQFIADMIVVDHKDLIVQKTVNATRASMELEVDREISNPTGETLPPNPDQTPHRDAAPKTAGDHEEEAFEGAMEKLGSGDY